MAGEFLFAQVNLFLKGTAIRVRGHINHCHVVWTNKEFCGYVGSGRPVGRRSVKSSCGGHEGVGLFSQAKGERGKEANEWGLLGEWEVKG